MSNPITLQLGGGTWTLAEIEDKMITIALAEAKGNREEAAKLLGIPVRSLWRKIASRVKKG